LSGRDRILEHSVLPAGAESGRDTCLGRSLARLTLTVSQHVSSLQSKPLCCPLLRAASRCRRPHRQNAASSRTEPLRLPAAPASEANASLWRHDACRGNLRCARLRSASPRPNARASGAARRSECELSRRGRSAGTSMRCGGRAGSSAGSDGDGATARGSRSAAVGLRAASSPRASRRRCRAHR
jgi:hypothetical protein